MLRRLGLAIVLSGAVTACQQADFSSKDAKKIPAEGRPNAKTPRTTDDGNPDPRFGNGHDADANGVTPIGEGQGNANDPTLDDGLDGLRDEQGIQIGEDDKVHAPKECSTATIAFAVANGNVKCPDDYAAYTLDDARQPFLGCCPLPAGDILTADPPTPRGGNCQADEVAVGVSGGGLLCAKINTERYALGQAKKTCYNGSGVRGGDGSAQCGAPPATLQALVEGFGSDACLGFPYGSLVVSRTGDECRDSSAKQLLFKDTMQPVTMFK